MGNNNYLPEFALYDQNKKEIRFSELKGKKLLLSFHPLAWTPVCEKQMKLLDKNYKKFRSLNTMPFGISVDSVPCKKAWSEAIDIKFLSLLSDFWPHGKFSMSLGLFYKDKGFSKRANLVIDENGIITLKKIYEISEVPDFEEILEFVSK